MKVSREVRFGFDKVRERIASLKRKPNLKWLAENYNNPPVLDMTKIDREPYIRIRRVVFGLENENPLYPIVKLMKECSKQEESVYVRGPKIFSDRFSFRDLMSMVVLNLKRGDNLQLYVERVHEDSKIFAIRLYTGLTTLDEFPAFDNLETRSFGSEKA